MPRSVLVIAPFLVSLGIALCAIPVSAGEPSPTPLIHAHAHNDYWHERPLFDALDAGFCSVEADIFLVDGGELLVGHSRAELKPKRTLAALYLDPLRRRAAENNGEIHPNVSGFSLLIDIKSDAKTTYAALHELLGKYGDILTTIRNGSVQRKAVTVIISGNRDFEGLTKQPVRYAGLDGRLSNLGSDLSSGAMPWISDNWRKHFTWSGEGPMPPSERGKLRDMVAKAHAAGRRVRFWATPDNEALWQELLAAKVDLIGTDNLPKLRDFLKRQRAIP